MMQQYVVKTEVINKMLNLMFWMQDTNTKYNLDTDKLINNNRVTSSKRRIIDADCIGDWVMTFRNGDTLFTLDYLTTVLGICNLIWKKIVKHKFYLKCDGVNPPRSLNMYHTFTPIKTPRHICINI